MNTIPASPIPQPTPKIGTRYVAVEHVPYRDGAWNASMAFANAKRMREYDAAWHCYMLLDPADAAELERLRKVEEHEAQAFIEDANLGTRAELGASFFSWTKARAARIAFEAKIGGGV